MGEDRLSVIAFEVGTAALAAVIGSLSAIVFHFGEQAWDGLSFVTALPFLFIGLVVTVMALTVAFPSMLLIALPIGWYFRSWILKYPLPSALGLGLIGAFAARTIHRWLDESLAAAQFEPTVMVCGAVSGTAFVYLHWRHRSQEAVAPK